VKADDNPDTDTHSWSPIDTYPPSSHTSVTASPVTRFFTSVEEFDNPPHSDDVGTWVIVGTTVGLRTGMAVGTVVGLVVGIVEGFVVGTTVGVPVGTVLGAEVGKIVSGLNIALHTTQESIPTCSPTDITYTVSAPCTVLSVVHWSSCSSNFTLVNVRSNGRIATISTPVAVPTEPYIAGITS
jgi:hypothetical protein